MSKKLTRENRAALQSVRAKARKALAVVDAPLTKTIIGHLEAVIAFVDGKLKVTAIVADTGGDGDSGQDAQTDAPDAEAATG